MYIQLLMNSQDFYLPFLANTWTFPLFLNASVSYLLFLPCQNIFSQTKTHYLYPMNCSHICSLGATASNSTTYHPTRNAQVKNCNGIVWKTVLLALHSAVSSVGSFTLRVGFTWCLYSICSLLCTSTNTTPHEQCFVFGSQIITQYNFTLMVGITQYSPFASICANK